jgi:YidC/Oxa1 family membrane protein insertase
VDRVQIAAIAVAVALIGVWFVTLPQPGERPQPPVAEAPGPPTAESPFPPEGAPRPFDDATLERAPQLGRAAEDEDDSLRHLRQDVTQAKVSVVENPALRIEVSSSGPLLRSIKLKQFEDRVGRGAGPVDLVTSQPRGTLSVGLGQELGEFEQTSHDIIEAKADRIELRSDLDSVRVTQILTLDPEGYGGHLRLAVDNRSERTVSPEFSLGWYGLERPPDAPDRFQNYSLVTAVDGELERRPLAGIGSPSFFGSLFGQGDWSGNRYAAPIEWGGLDSQYFLLAAIPENPREARAFQGPLGREAGLSLVGYPPFQVPPGHRVERLFRLYFGPKVHSAVEEVDPGLGIALTQGWAVFSPLVDLFSFMLRWTYEHVVPNYGLAIILLTILLRLVTFPLTQKSMKSMKRFQTVIGPEMKTLQEKYKDDKERLQQEMMALYRRKGMNPFSALGGGCVPMLIQFPFLIALYFALQGSIELRHAPFVLWIHDLSAPESFFSIAGIPIRVLPLLMGASMILQQRLMPSAGSDPQQRQMMMWMSVFFIFLFYGFPAGLVLYWLVSNILGILQQLLVNTQVEGQVVAKQASEQASSG